MGILDMLQTSPSGGKGGGIVERARETYNPNRYDGVQLGMIGGVKPGGGYWQGLDGNGLAHASDPSYEDYSQRFREFSFAEKPGWVPVGQRDGRTVYAAPDYVKTDGVYDMFSAGEAAKYAGMHGLLLPTRDEVKSFYDQATHIPMPTQNIGAMGGPGDAAAYTAAIGDVQGPVVHGKEWYVAGDQNASAAPSQPPIRNYANAIAAVESRGSGDYLAVGPKTRTGARAYGRYQVMDFNVGPWTEKYYGKRLTPQEFLANPQAQDAVFNGEFGSYVEKYGNPQDAASVWFTGKPLAEGGGRSDGYITGNEYVDRFTRFLGDGTTVMASNNPGQQIADDTMRALGMDPTQQQPQPRGVMDFLKGTETGGERSYLGGWLTPDRRDNLIMALQGMTLNPNAAMINAASDRISAREGRKTKSAQQNKTKAFIQGLVQQGRADPSLLGLVDIDPGLALQTALAQPETRDPTAGMQNYEYLIANGVDPAEAMARAFSGGVTVNTGDQGPSMGTIPPGYTAVTDDTNPSGYRLEPIPGGPVADEKAALNEKDALAAAGTATSTQTITTATDNALAAADSRVVGGLLGQAASFNPSSQNAEIYRQVDVLRANARIENLQAMRAASPTGGALGPVSDSEGKMLESASGALDPASPNFERDVLNYTRTLLRVVHGGDAGEAIFNQKYGERWREIMGETVTPTDQPGRAGGDGGGNRIRYDENGNRIQ